MVVLGILTYCIKGLFERFGRGYCLHLRGESLVKTDAEVTVRANQPKGKTWTEMCAFRLGDFPICYEPQWGTAVAQWLRCCVTNRKVAGSIPAGVSGFFIDIKSFRSHYGPGVDSASNRNEYQEHFLRVKAAGA